MEGDHVYLLTPPQINIATKGLEKKGQKVRPTDSCATPFCFKDHLRNNIFVDIPWQQTTVGLLLPAGNAVSLSLCLQLSKLHQSGHPPWQFTLLVEKLHFLDLFLHLEPASNLPMHYIYNIYCSSSEPVPTFHFPILNLQVLKVQNNINLFKAHTFLTVWHTVNQLL